MSSEIEVNPKLAIEILRGKLAELKAELAALPEEDVERAQVVGRW